MLKAFYSLVFQRAWTLAFDRARRFGFWVAPVGAVLLLLTWSLLPPSWPPLLAKLLPYAALLSLGVLALNLLWMLFVRAPYELYCEKIEALEAALRVNMASERRLATQNALVTFLEKGQHFTGQLERWNSGALTHEDMRTGTDMDIGREIIQWITEVATYIRENLEPIHRTRFSSSAYFPTEETMGLERQQFLPGVKARCDNLEAIITDFS